MQIISTLSERRACMGVGEGDRGASGPARAAMQLVQVVDAGARRIKDGPRGAMVVDGEPVAITTPGLSTARRRLPAVVARMDERDPRRVAVDRYALAVEKVGAVAGASAEGMKADGGAATNDGGVTTRILYAATIHAVERVLDRAATVLTPSARGGGYRRAITARELVDAICLNGSDMKSILVAAGWSGHRRDVARLSRAAEEQLEEMARALGLVAPGAPRPEPS
ncbi:MAG: hypothetical protein EpisKO_05940 [Epibacterium sp.]